MAERTDGKRFDALQKIAEEVSNLRRSPLFAYRESRAYFPVIGEGNLHARIMIVGEAPGESEAKSGRPFVGASGRFLDELLESIGIERNDVYITNIVKDRPPENRDPSQDEIDTYAPFLEQQIQIIEPKVIVTLGRFAMEFIFHLFGLQTDEQKISQVHGKHYQAKADYGDIWIVPLYHPAVGLYNRNMRSTLKEDIQSLRKFVNSE